MKINLIDVCLPGYVNQHTDVAVPVDNKTTWGQIAVAIENDLNYGENFESMPYSEADVRSAVIDFFMKHNISNLMVIAFPDLPESEEDGENVYAYFTVSFT